MGSTKQQKTKAQKQESEKTDRKTDTNQNTM